MRCTISYALTTRQGFGSEALGSGRASATGLGFRPFLPVPLVISRAGLVVIDITRLDVRPLLPVVELQKVSGDSDQRRLDLPFVLLVLDDIERIVDQLVLMNLEVG